MKTIKQFVLGTALVVVSVSSLAGLYRWVDENGQVHYSDTPNEGAEEIELKESNVMRSFKARTTSAPGSGGELALEEEEAFAGYSQLIISAPDDDEVLWNIEGRLNVQLSVEPQLQKGHGVVVFLDGQRINQQPQASTSLIIDDVYRGTHTVRAAVYSDTGKLMINGNSVTFHVRQSTVPRG